MSTPYFKAALLAIAIAFTAFFLAIVVPALMVDPDIPAAFAAGFVNPFSSGYSADVLFCWAALAVWVVYERRHYGVKHGPVCLLLAVVPGVAVGFALYLVLRHRQVDVRSRA